MPKKLSDRSTLENIKKEAKRWLAALRAGDATAHTRLAAVTPEPPTEPALRHVQHALALEYGFSGWSALKDALEKSHDASTEIVASLLDAAVRGDAPRAATILDAHPAIVSSRGLLTGHTGLRTALHHAVSGSHEAVVRLLLDRGADPNVRDEGDNAFPLHFVAEKENLSIMRLLIEHGADPIGTGDTHELEVIGWATVFGSARPDVVAYLLAHGARHNMYSAVATGDVAAIRTVAAERPADVDRPMDRTNHHRRPLHLAIVKKHAASLDALLALGADVNAADAAGLTPLDQAALNGETRMVMSLLDRGAALSLPAAIVLDRDVDRLLAANAAALRPGERWGTLIIRAAEQAPGRVIESLIKHGASVNVVDDETTAVDSARGYTPLHAAAFRGNLDAARTLLAHGASVIARDSKYHGTPAGWANYAGHHALRDEILRGPIDMFDAISFDLVDRLRGIFDRNPGVLNAPMKNRLLREPEPDEWTKSWWTPLAFAVVNGTPAAVRELLELGARATVRDPDGKTLIELATARGNADIVTLLTEYGDRAESLAKAVDGDDGEQVIARFLTNACPDHHVRGGWAHIVARDAALRLLERHPEIARANICTAVVCGEIDEVKRILGADPDAARRKAGPKGSARAAGQEFMVEPTRIDPPQWEPLLYLCFSRLPTAQSRDNAVEIARLLLGHGGDPNSYFMAGDSRYSPLTGVIGEGEEDRHPHPRRDELTRLLLERGANPYDVQVFYNIHFHGRVRWYLELAYEYSVKNGRRADWADPQWSMIGMGGYGLGARYVLSIAVNHDDTELATWALTHGADPNATLPSWSKLQKHSVYEEAVRRGHLAVAEVLERFGAVTSTRPVNDEATYIAAALRGDRAEVERILAKHPEYRRSPAAIFAAARRDRADVVEMLLDLGTSIEVEDKERNRPLHMAAYQDAARVAQLLIDRGAEIDPVETSWSNTPLDAAIYGQHSNAIEVLGRYSRDVWSLTFIGQVERLRLVLAERPELAKVSWEGTTLLMRLPGDEARALEIAKLLLSLGADPTSRNKNGESAAEIAEKRGMPDLAELLR